MATLFHNASWSGASAAFRAASGLFNALLAVRLLGVDNYGHVATVLSLFVLYLSLNSSVFTALVVKLMSLSDVGEKHSLLIASSWIFTALSIAVLVVVTILFREFAPQLLTIDPGTPLDEKFRRVILLMGVLTTIQTMVALHSALIESTGRLDLAMKWQLIGSTIVLILLATFFFARLTLSAADYVGVLCAGALTDLGLLWLVKRKVMTPAHFYWPTRKRLQSLMHLLKSGGVLQATSLMGMFLEPLNKLLLNHFVGAAAVTIYDLAMKIIWGIQYLFSAAMRVFLHLGSQNEEAVGPTFNKVIALIGVPVVILHTFGALFLSWIAHHWLAIDATQLMIFFAIATLSNLGMIYITPLYISLIGRGDLGFIFRCQAILAATNVVVTLTLIPYLGLVGAAFGLLTATLYNVVAIYARCKANADMFDGFKDIVKGRRVSYVMTAVLFAVAIILGISGEESFVGFVAILLGLIAVMFREPMIDILLMRLGFKS